MATTSGEQQRPNCNHCAAFHVTYDPQRPYGCRTFQMKSKALPAQAVRDASGEECRAFSPKEPAPTRSPKR
jgi:hypothetical protein